ncbi:MAG: amidase family protein, partial [Pseudomonadota bacterium]
MTDITELKLAELRDGLAKKEFSAADATDAYLQRAEGSENLNAYIRITGDAARAQAKASDEKIAKGEAGPLEGIPLG